MAITTLDGMLAGVQPLRFWAKSSIAVTRSQSLWGQPGIPGAGGYDTTLNGVALTAPVNGMLARSNPAGGTNAYVSRTNFVHVTGTSGGWAMLCDRLWHNGGLDVTSTASQAITSPTWPARDIGGATSGTGVLIAVEVSATVVGAATPTFTVGYTNSSGTSGRSGANISATVGAPAAGSAWIIGLQAGDFGVRSVQSLTLSNAWTSGTINLVAFRPVSMLSCGANLGSGDCITGGFPRVFNSSVLYWMTLLSVAPAVCFGTYVESQG